MDCVTGSQILMVLARVAVIVCVAVLVMYGIDEMPSLWRLHDEKEHREWRK